MASQTEYNMLFKLSAQLGKEFGATFSSAQKSVKETQKQIQALNKQQSDISAYQKQQQSVEATTKKLADLQQQYNNIQREIQETEGFSSSLENKLIEKQRAIEKTSASLQTQTQKLDDMGEALRESGVDTDHLAEASNKLSAEMDHLAEEQARAAEEAKNYGEEGANAFEAVGAAFIAAGVQKMLSELIGLYKESVTEARQYADEILTVSAQYGVATHDLQAYYYAAELVDVSVDTITKSMAKNIKSMAAAQDGTRKSVEAYDALGVSVTNADGSLRDSEIVYWEVIDALGAMKNETERDSIAQQLLGRSALELNTLIKAGSGVMKEYADEAEKAGYILSDDVLATLGALDDAEQKQQNNLKALQNSIGNAFAPELTKLKELENEFLAGLTEFISEHPVLVKSIIALTAGAATLLGVYTTYVAVKKGLNAIRAISTTLKAAETAATVAQTAATEAETTAQVGLNAAMMANPIGLVIGAVAALTVGVIALVSAVNKANDPSKKLTETTRKQKAELEKLNAEYKEACTVYGETSEEASRLRYEMNDLETAIEANGQSVEEFVNECNDLATSAQKVISDYKETTDEIRQNELGTLALIQKLDDLASQNVKTAATEEQMRSIIAGLNEQMPELALSYDDVATSAEKYVEIMRNFAKKKAEDDKQEARMKSYSAALIEQEKLIKQIDEAEENLRLSRASDDNAWFLSDAWFYKVTGEGWLGSWATSTDEYKESLSQLRAKLSETQKTISDITAEWEEYGEIQVKNALNTEKSEKQEILFNQAINAVKNGYMSADQAAKYYGIDLEELESRIDSLEKSKESLIDALKAVQDGFLTAEEAADAYGTTVEKIEGYKQIKETITALDELVSKYNEAYEAAEKSINGQYALWDTAAVVIATDIGSINTALETQLSYWSDYNTDLTNLLARTDDVDGLAEVIASFADGSKDSVNAIAGMAAASDEELKTMVSNWQEVQAQQEEAAKSIAEIASDYSKELDNMLDDVNDSVDALNLDDEATAAAKATVQAYAQAIRDGTWDAVKAAEDMASLVANALSRIPVSPTSAEGGGSWSSYEDAAAAGYSNIRTRSEFSRSNNADKQKYGTYDAYLKAMQEKYSAYASGTSSAEAGMALVGEEGPELVLMRGGETVLNAQETRSRLGESVVITISPAFTVTGGGDIEEQLRAFSDELIEEVKDALEQSGINARRSVYA